MKLIWKRLIYVAVSTYLVVLVIGLYRLVFRIFAFWIGRDCLRKVLLSWLISRVIKFERLVSCCVLIDGLALFMRIGIRVVDIQFFSLYFAFAKTVPLLIIVKNLLQVFVCDKLLYWYSYGVAVCDLWE